MNGKVIVVVLLVVTAAIGIFVALSGSSKMPAIQVANHEGEMVALDQLYNDRAYMMLTVVVSGCPLSQFAVKFIGEQLAPYRDAITVIALAFRGTAKVEKMLEEAGIEMEVVALKPRSDPYAYNEFIKWLGDGNRVWGGTVAMLDDEGKLLFKLVKDDIKTLADELQDLGI